MGKVTRVVSMIVGMLFLASCAGNGQVGGPGNPAHDTRQTAVAYEPVQTILPAYRIDNQMKRISIIGSGPDHEQMQSILTMLFTEKSDIKVVEPANLQSVLAGKVIEYQTGIAPDDAQVLSRMFQIDHLVLFDVQMGPYSAYKFGGRAYAVVNLKIVNTVNGEILFQTSRNVGMRFDDPRKYGYRGFNEGDFPGLRSAALTSVAYELRYALNDVMAGWVLNPGTNVVSAVLVSSLADKAGIRKGDAIVGINDVKISIDQDLVALARQKASKQGDEATIRIERNGKSMELRVQFPVIPLRPHSEWNEDTGGGTKAQPGNAPKVF